VCGVCVCVVWGVCVCFCVCVCGVCGVCVYGVCVGVVCVCIYIYIYTHTDRTEENEISSLHSFASRIRTRFHIRMVQELAVNFIQDV